MINWTRRAVLATAALLTRAAAARAWGPATPVLRADKEMAVQVIDIGWRRESQMFDTAGPSGAVTNEIYTLETAAHHVRFRFQNGLTAPWTIDGAAFAPTALAQSNPVDAGGAPIALRPVTFGNNGQDVALEDQTGGSGAAVSLTLPPADAGRAFPQGGFVFRGVPTIVFSDWMPFTPVPRRDGYPGFLLMLRARTPSPEFTGVKPARIDHQGLFAGTPARPWRALFVPRRGAAPNALTTPNFSEPEPLWNFIGNGLCCGVQAVGDIPGLTLLSVGDSVLMGGGETQGYLGPIKRAADMMSTPRLPVSHIQSAIFGAPSGAFYPAGKEALRTNKVSCAFIQVWSGNDPRTLQAAQASWRQALGLADYCSRRGTVAIFVSPGPPEAGQPLMRNIHLWTMAMLRQRAAQGHPFLDLYKVLGNGAPDDASTLRRPGLRAEDHVHLNSEGNTLVAEAAKTLLGTLPIKPS